MNKRGIGVKKFWSKMTPEQRSAEMKRRLSLGKRQLTTNHKPSTVLDLDKYLRDAIKDHVKDIEDELLTKLENLIEEKVGEYVDDAFDDFVSEIRLTR